MKKNLLYLALVLAFCTAHNLYAQICCPDFTVQIANDVCSQQRPDGTGGNGSAGAGGGSNGNPNGGKDMDTLCQYSTYTYLATPIVPGFTYTWAVTGGTPTSFTGNPISITWGNGPVGTITLIVKNNLDTNCVKKYTVSVYLRPGPKAQFTFAPGNPVCAGTSVVFTNTSIGGTVYTWNFGDGSPISNLFSPTHPFASPGTYIVTLTVTTAQAPDSNHHAPCPCVSTFQDTIKVVSGTSLAIIDTGCKKMFCDGDTGHYCSSLACPPYTWSVVGGMIVTPNPSTQSCIDVAWNPAPNSPQPSISLSVPSSCVSTGCSNSTTLLVPVLYSGIPITGLTTVCAGSTSSYSIPTLPGTFMHWKVTPGMPGASIITADSNNEIVTVAWNNPGTYTLECDYHNPFTKCSGITKLTVNVLPKLTINGQSQSCAGCNSYYFTNAASGNWTLDSSSVTIATGTGNSFSHVWANVSTMTTYTLSVAAPGYCNSPVAMTIQVAPLPILTNLKGPSMLCPGSTGVYSVTTNTPGTTIMWNVTPSGTATPLDANGDSAQVTFSGNGPFYVTAMQYCLFNCNYAQLTDTVNTVPAPSSITGSNSTCMDVTLPYSVSNIVPGVSYNWTITPAAGGTIVSGQGTGNISVLWHGTTGGGSNTYTLQVSNCAGSASSTITVATPPTIAITASGTLCPSGVTLTIGSIPAGYTASWTLGNGPSLGSSASYVATVAGIYHCTVTGPGGCMATATYVVPKQALPGAHISVNGPIIYCLNSGTYNLTFTAVGGGGYSFQWYQNSYSNPVGTNSGTYTITNQSTATLGSNTYWVVVTLGGCKDTSNAITISVINCPSGPNPCPAGVLTIAPVNYCVSHTFSASVTAGNTMGTISWDFGDGYGGSGTPITHNYQYPGTYNVTATAIVTDANGNSCLAVDTIQVVVPLVPNFMINANCGVISLSDQSLYNAGCAETRTWSVATVSGGAISPTNGFFSSNTAANPTLTFTLSGTYNITLTATVGAPCSCTQTITQQITVTLPVDSIIPPTHVCLGVPANFSAYNPGSGTCHWDFGDGYTSNLCATEHAYGSAGIKYVTLTVTDANGCTATAKDTITVDTLPTCTIPPKLSICPGDTGMIIASASPYSTFQWYQVGSNTVISTSDTLKVWHFGQYYVIATDTGDKCPVVSDTCLVTLYPPPIAKIMGNSVFCYGPGNMTFTLMNKVNLPPYMYSWSSSNPGVISFSPATSYFPQNSTVVTLTNPTSPVYQIYLTVTDTSTGCVSHDTLCLYPAQSPMGYINASGNCAWHNNLLYPVVTPAPNNMSTPPIVYSYQWNTGQTSDSIIAYLPGVYTVLVTNLASGCSTQLTFAILPEPDLSLFPLGCDSMCNNPNDTINVPLPINPPPSMSSYTINWYDGSNPTPIYTGPGLPVSLLSLGVHNLYIVVTGPPFNSCPDTSGKFIVKIVKCDTCSCNNHHLTNISYMIGNAPAFTETKCGAELPKIACDSVKIKASFSCDSGCTATVSATLTGPNNATIYTWSPVGVNGISFMPSPGMVGNYTVHLYGKCGDKICDSCTLMLSINCPPVEGDSCVMCPPGLKSAIHVTMTPKAMTLDSIGGSHFNNLPVSVQINTGTIMLTEVSAQVVSDQINPSYGDCLTCDNKPAGWVSITGQTLGGIAGTNAGVAQALPSANNSFMNPREVVWASTTPFTLNPGNTSINVYLPALANVPCCTLSGIICIKFSFRDANCKVCDTVICFPFGGATDTACGCGNWNGVTFASSAVSPTSSTDDKLTNEKSAVISPTGPTPINIPCGKAYTIGPKVSFSFSTSYQCTGTCKAIYQWVLTNASGGIVQQGTSSNGSVPGGLAPGSYTLSYTVICGNKDCPGCKIPIKVSGGPK